MSITARLAEVRNRIARACQISRRDPASVTLIAISKFHPVDAIREAYDMGQRHFGESRLQEAMAKIEVLPGDIVWHFVGPLQSNKAKRVASLFQVIHGFCSPSQLSEIDRGAHDVEGLIEVNIANEPQKFGISNEQLDEYHASVLQSTHVRFRGLMMIGPAVSDAELMRPYFAELKRLGTQVQADWLSMGMSEDFEVAIQEGATHVRVGTSIFGSRN